MDDFSVRITADNFDKIPHDELNAEQAGDVPEG